MAAVNYAGANHVVFVTNDMDPTMRFHRDPDPVPAVREHLS